MNLIAALGFICTTIHTHLNVSPLVSSYDCSHLPTDPRPPTQVQPQSCPGSNKFLSYEIPEDASTFFVLRVFQPFGLLQHLHHMLMNKQCHVRLSIGTIHLQPFLHHCHNALPSPGGDSLSAPVYCFGSCTASLCATPQTLSLWVPQAHKQKQMFEVRQHTIHLKNNQHIIDQNTTVSTFARRE